MTRRRAPHHDSDMYAIFRKSKTGEGQQAWLVNLTRGGRRIQTTFSDSTYGGEAQSLHVARAYRDAVLEVVPPLTNRDVRTALRSTRPEGSDMTGVYYIEATERRPARWIARIDVADDTKASGRRNISRTFNIASRGHEEAKRAAEDERIRMVLAVENGEDPALRNPAAIRLHDRLAKARNIKPAEKDEDRKT